MSDEILPFGEGEHAFADAQDACYRGLPDEVCERLEQRALRIQTILTRDVLELGQELAAVREEYRHNKHGGFEQWVKKKTVLSLSTAYNCLDVSKHFGNLVNFTRLDIAKSAQYVLAAESTPQEARVQAIQRAEAGEKITLTVAKELIEAQQAQRRAEEAARVARAEVQQAHEDLAQQEAHTRAEIANLTQQLTTREKDMVALSRPRVEVREVEKSGHPARDRSPTGAAPGTGADRHRATRESRAQSGTTWGGSGSLAGYHAGRTRARCAPPAHPSAVARGHRDVSAAGWHLPGTLSLCPGDTGV